MLKKGGIRKQENIVVVVIELAIVTAVALAFLVQAECVFVSFLIFSHHAKMHKIDIPNS